MGAVEHQLNWDVVLATRAIAFWRPPIPGSQTASELKLGQEPQDKPIPFKLTTSKIIHVDDPASDGAILKETCRCCCFSTTRRY